MEGGGLNERTLRRLPFVLAGVCLATGAFGLAMTFSERTALVAFEPVDYSLMVQDPSPPGPTSTAPGSALDRLQPESELMAAVTEEPAAPVFTAPPAARASAASAGGSTALAVVPAIPVTPPAEDPGVVLGSEPPPVPEAPAAVPAAPTSNSRPGVSIVTANTGTSLPAYDSRLPSANDDRAAPSQTNRQQATPTATPAQQQKATPTATPPSKSKGNSNKN